MATFQYSAQANGSSIDFDPTEVTGDVLNFDATILPHDVYLVRDENVGGSSADDLSVAIIDGASAGKHVFLWDMDAKQVTTSNFTFASGGSIFAGDNLSTTATDDQGNVQSGTGVDDLFIGFGGNDSQTGKAGNDVFAFYLGADGHYSGAAGDTINGSSGIDTLRFLDQGEVGANVNLTTGIVTGGDIDGTSNAHVSNVEWIAGTIFNDNFMGDSKGNVLTGRDGDDTLRGAAGGDTIEGGAGNDMINGGDNRDWIDYQHAVDGVVVDMDTNPTSHRGTASDGQGGTDTLIDVENVIGSAFGDDVTGNANGNVLDLRDGKDMGNGDAGDDTVFGGAGNDKLYGGLGDDLLYGGVGSDSYYGGPGNDTFVGSGSNAFISDGVATLGKDTFNVLSVSQGVDTIFAFDTSTTGMDANVDVIDFTALFNAIGYTGTDPFADGYLKIENGGGGEGDPEATDAIISVDINGGGDSWTEILHVADVTAAAMMSNPDYFTFQ